MRQRCGEEERAGRKEQDSQVVLSRRQPSAIPPCFSVPSKAPGSHPCHPDQQARLGERSSSPDPAPCMAGAKKATLERKVAQSIRYCPLGDEEEGMMLKCGMWESTILTCRNFSTPLLSPEVPAQGRSSEPPTTPPPPLYPPTPPPPCSPGTRPTSQPSWPPCAPPHPFQLPTPHLRSHSSSDCL